LIDFTVPGCHSQRPPFTWITTLKVHNRYTVWLIITNAWFPALRVRSSVSFSVSVSIIVPALPFHIALLPFPWPNGNGKNIHYNSILFERTNGARNLA